MTEYSVDLSRSITAPRKNYNLRLLGFARLSTPLTLSLSPYIYIYIYHQHHHVVPQARIILTLFRHFSLSFIASGRMDVQVF